MMKRKELDLLINDIVNGEQVRFKEKKFNVYSTETSSGKTAALIEGCVKIHKENKNKIVLVVTKLVEEQLRVAKEINELAGEKIAIALISDKNKKPNTYETTDYTQIIDYKIVVITHSLYCLVSKSRGISDIKKHDYIFNYYCNNSIDSVLVIDEELNPVKNSFAALSVEELANLRMLFNGLYIDISEEEKNSQHIYYIFCSWIEKINCLLSGDMQEFEPINMIHRVKEIELQNDIPLLKDDQEAYNDYMYQSLIDNFNINKYGREISNYIERYSLSNPKKINYTFEGVKDTLKIIHQTWKCLINGICLIQPTLRTLYSYDYSFSFLMLGNNIMLDASACFTKIYKSNMFNVIPTERIIDHSNCKLYLTKYNTTTSNKKRNAYKYKCVIIDYIERTIDKDEKGLVISSEADCQLLKKNLKPYNNLDYRNFDNMRGLNNYRDYNKMFLVHTPRQLTPYYVFCYEWYFKKNMTDKEMETKIIKNDFLNSWGFINCNDCQDIMISDMASSIYQGIKRIERNTEPKAIWHIWIKDIDTLRIVIKQLNGFSKDNIILVEDSNNTYNKNAVVEIPENYLGVPLNDEIKREIAEHIGLTNKGIKVGFDKLINNIKSSGYIFKKHNNNKYIYTQEILDNMKLKEIENIKVKEQEKEMKREKLINYLDSIIGKVLIGEEIEELKAMFDNYGTNTRSLSFKALTGFCEDEGLPYIINNNDGKQVKREGKKYTAWKVSKIIG